MATDVLYFNIKVILIRGLLIILHLTALALPD